MEFNYVGRDSKGTEVKGSLIANSKAEAATILRSQSVAVSRIKEVKKTTKKEEKTNRSDTQQKIEGSFFAKKPGLDDFMILSHQLHTLLKGGVTLLASVQSMIPYIDNKILRSMLEHIVTDLESGYTMAQSLSRHRQYVPDVMMGMVQAGEVTGNMEEVFLKLGEHFEKEKETQDKIRAVMRYPIIVFIVILVALLVMNVMVIPVFSKIFTRFGSELPFLTQLLLNTSYAINTYWEWFLSITGIIYISWGRWLKSESGRFTWDKYKLKIPVFGTIMHRGTLSRLCHSISMTFSSGMPIMQGLNIAGASTGNLYFAAKMEEMSSGLEEGHTLSVVAERSRVFHPLAMQMLAAGEMTGSVDETMSRVAYYYDRQVEQEIKALSEKLEPFLIFGVGIMVLVLALGIFIPLWDMSSVILGKNR